MSPTRLSKYQVLYCSSFLSFKDALCDGLCTVNKDFHAFFKESRRIRARKLKIQKAIVRGCLYHYGKGLNSKYDPDAPREVAPEFDYSKGIPRSIINHVPGHYHYLIENAMAIIKRLLEEGPDVPSHKA